MSIPETPVISNERQKPTPVVKIVFVVFLGPSCRETAENAIKKTEGKYGREKVFSPSTFLA
jgi:hypothetical protein